MQGKLRVSLFDTISMFAFIIFTFYMITMNNLHSS